MPSFFSHPNTPMTAPHPASTQSTSLKSTFVAAMLSLNCLFAFPLMAEENLGALVFSDDFARTETQSVKDEPGNGWNTSSSWSAKGNKQAALKHGALDIYI